MATKFLGRPTDEFDEEIRINIAWLGDVLIIIESTTRRCSIFESQTQIVTFLFPSL